MRQMYQPRMFDGEMSRPGKPCFGCTAHYHYVSYSESPQAWHGAKMVQSDITEMLANVSSKYLCPHAGPVEKGTLAVDFSCQGLVVLKVLIHTKPIPPFFADQTHTASNE